jgi:pyridoxal phosphate enzyme (YggS family)
LSVAENIAHVQERIAAAARQAARSPDEITLMAVSKTFGPEAIREAYADGIRVFGENRVQEFAGKAAAVHDFSGAEWHMIGHLQTNKASKAVELFSAVDSVDSLRLAEKLNAAAAEHGKKIPILIEVNVGGEEAKSGAAPGSQEFENLLRAAPRLEHLQIRGLMTIPPYTEDPAGARPFFKAMRRLAIEVATRQLTGVEMSVLSMGMSHDFEVAIEEGSTCVRVGTAIFGERPVARSKQ